VTRSIIIALGLAAMASSASAIEFFDALDRVTAEAGTPSSVSAPAVADEADTVGYGSFEDLPEHVQRAIINARGEAPGYLDGLSFN
jgi:hypothetical protein